MGDFRIWRNKLKILEQIYQLNDKHLKILVGLRLRGKALAWLHSADEYMLLSTEELFKGLGAMFDQQFDNMVLHERFRARKWRKDESFSDYMSTAFLIGDCEATYESVVCPPKKNWERVSRTWSTGTGRTRLKVAQEGISRDRGTRTVKLERAGRRRAEAVWAEDASRERGTASAVDCPITSIRTARKEHKDQNTTNSVSMDTLRPNALNNRKPRALSMRELLVKNA